MNCIGALYDRTAAMRSYQSQGQKDLKNVSLVANAFRAFAQPHIFFRLSLGMPEGDLLDRIEGLQSLYDCRPESAGWTKYLRYRGTFRALSTDDHGEAIVGAMSSLFVRLHNLRNISIVSFDLTIEMLRHVYALRGPLTLGLYAVPDPKEGDESLDVEILNVGDLDIGGPTEGSVELIPQLALCPRLHTLRLREPAASRVFDYANSRTFTSIQHLHLPNPQSKTLSSFLSFLSACPNATSLYLGEGEIVGAAGRPDCILPPSTLPCLSSFYGVISDARRFIPGRPIHTVEAWVADGQEQALSEDVLSPLTKGSVQLRRLYLKFIPWTDGVLKNLVKLFPNIEELDISAWKEISAVSTDLT